MKPTKWKTNLSLGILLVSMSGCQLADRIEYKAAQINSYEQKSLVLAKENRLLKAEISNLNAEIQTLKAKNNFLKIKLGKVADPTAKRGPASLPPVDVKNDLVKYHIYRWSPKQLLQIGETEFAKKNYEKSAQFFRTFHSNHSKDERLNDDFLFQLGVSSYHSGKHYDWAIKYLNELIVKYPTSLHYRRSKLWIALAKHKLGRNNEFFEHVEEFRLKYRNTAEWKILRDHYEEIRENYKD